MAEITTLERISRVEMGTDLGLLFDAIDHATTRGERKFAPHVSRKLARTVICRAYGGPIFELTQLIAAGETVFADHGYESLFWDDGPANRTGFQRRFIHALERTPSGPRPVTRTTNGIHITYPDGAFTIAFSRMPFLCAVLDFLVSSIGYGAVDDAIRGALQAPMHRAPLSRAANDITRQLYDFLKPRLPSAQAQRKYRSMVAFLRARRNGGPVRLEDLDDAAVLDFWLQQSPNQCNDTDWKTYRTVVSAFVHLYEALKASQVFDAIETAKPVGPDTEAGEVDPADVLGACIEVDRRREPLEVLRSAPANGVKFLNKREVEAVETIVTAGDAAYALPLSVLRAEIFGTVQAAISQHLRRGEAPAKAVDLACQNHAETYQHRTDRLAATLDQANQALLAAYHVLARAHHGDAIGLLLHLKPEIDLTPMAPLLSARVRATGNVMTMGATALREEFFATATGCSDDCPELVDFVSIASRAHGRIGRKGFSAIEADQPAVIEGFAAGCGALLRLRDTLKRFSARLERLLPTRRDRDHRFVADRSLFFTQFRVLYGAKS